MALKVQSLDELDQTLVDQAFAELSQLIRERHPELDLTRGVFDDLVAYFAGGVSGGVNQTEVNRVLQAGSLLSITANPQLADPLLVDRVLSNFRVTRKAGRAATGTIAVIVQDNITTVIPASTLFVANGVSYQPGDVYTARPTGSLLQADNERLLQPLGDGRYSFAFPATATVDGPDGDLKRGAQFVPSTVPGNYVNSYANTDFTGGVAEELNNELISRLQEGIAAKVMQGRVNIAALLKEEPAFADVVAFSIVGYGNAEMSRDQHWIFPASGGGRIDIYARTQPLYKAMPLTKEATLVATVAGGGVWQVTLGRDEAPGFYEVDNILLPTDAADTVGFEPTFDLRGVDLSGAGFRPDVVDGVEAAFTRYQTAVIRFIDDRSSLTGKVIGDKANYVVALRTMPLVAELQEYCNGSGVRNLMADVLMKAAVPCFLTINYEIQQGAGEQDPDLDAINGDLLDRVNSLGFPGQIHAGLVAEIIYGHLTSRQAVRNIDLLGRIKQPNGRFRIIRASDVLTIPDDPGNMVTPRTTSFILSPDTIGVSVITAGFEVPD